MIERTERGLKVTWPDGLTFTFHPLWLRERSFEEANKDPATGHRLQEACFLPLEIGLSEAEESTGQMVHLAFTDGHRCGFELADLRSCVEHPFPDDLIGDKVYWGRDSAPLPWHDFENLTEAGRLLALVNDLARSGFVLVQGLGIDAQALERLTGLIGPIRQTNWGGLADVISMADPFDLSMTGRALEPHVDNPYRLPGPGYIFLHCQENSAQGGESIIIDGFHAAACLRDQDWGSYEILTEMPVTFRYADNDAILEHHGPLIELRPDGQVHRVRFHNRADQVIAADHERLERYYRARRRFAELLWSDEMILTLKLQPGEAYIVDNYRIFHGRKEIDLSTGNRHLRQCYMDRDIVSSRQKVLLRDGEEAVRRLAPS